MNKKIISIWLIMMISFFSVNLFANDVEIHTSGEKKEYQSKTLSELAVSFYETTGIKALVSPQDNVMTDEPNLADSRKMTSFEQTWGRIIMFLVVGVLFYLAIAKGFEPLLLLSLIHI